MTIKKEPKVSLEITVGNRLLLNVEATGYPAPNYQWYRDNERLDDQQNSILQVRVN